MYLYRGYVCYEGQLCSSSNFVLSQSEDRLFLVFAVMV